MRFAWFHIQRNADAAKNIEAARTCCAWDDCRLASLCWIFFIGILSIIAIITSVAMTVGYSAIYNCYTCPKLLENKYPFITFDGTNCVYNDTSAIYHRYLVSSHRDVQPACRNRIVIILITIQISLVLFGLICLMCSIVTINRNCHEVTTNGVKDDDFIAHRSPKTFAADISIGLAAGCGLVILGPLAVVSGIILLPAFLVVGLVYWLYKTYSPWHIAMHPVVVKNGEVKQYTTTV